MRILHVYKDYHPVIGGIENHIKGLAEAQARAGHRVSVLVTSQGRWVKMELLNDVEVLRVGRAVTLSSTPISFGFPSAFRRQSPDITHLHSPYPIAELSQLVVGRGRPYVITYHSDVINPKQQFALRLYAPLLRRVLRQAKGIVATSPNYIESSPFLHGLAARCTVVPIGLDSARFRGAKPARGSSEHPTLLFVGKHRYYKGVDHLLRAMRLVEGRLLVAGDGPMRARWEGLAEKLDLSDRVTFLGEVAEAHLAGLYKSADVFVLPATLRAEAFGTVLLEAMASGLPCITTELGTGTSYVVQDGISGLVVPPCDPEALAEAIDRLAADAALRTRMGRAGQERVMREFAHGDMVDRLEALYQEVLDPHTSEAGRKQARANRE